MGVSFLMLLASTLVPLAQEGWDAEMRTITEQAQHPELERGADLDAAALKAAQLGPRPDLRERLRDEGLQDGLILPVVVISPALPDIRQAWRSYVVEHILAQGVTHYGMALEGDTLAVVFARRLFVPEALPSTPRVGFQTEVRGRVSSKVRELRALVGRPDELVSTAEISRQGDTLTIALKLNAGDGTYLVELLGTTERGPEVLAMLPIRSEGSNAEPSGMVPLSTEATYGPPQTQLIQMINRDRRRLGLPALRRSETLATSASRHAEAMARTGFAAHVLPGGRPPADRLARFDLETPRFHENVAMASSVAQAHSDLWSSPSHRRALIDPRVNRIGVGVETVQTEGGPIHFVVQHLARL